MTYPISPAPQPGRHSQSPVRGWPTAEHAPFLRRHDQQQGGDSGWWERLQPPPPEDVRRGGFDAPYPGNPLPAARPAASGYGPPAAGPEYPQPGPADPNEHEPENPAWVDVRNLVAARLRTINSTHTHEAFDRVGKRNALSPHGVVLLYTIADRTQPSGVKLHFVTRFFLQGPESDELPAMLQDLHRSALNNIKRSHAAGQRWDPRGPENSMVNGGEMDMPREADYLGVAVSTLDTEDVNWRDAVRSLNGQPDGVGRARTVFDLAGRSIAHLIDGTTLLVVRDPHRPLGDTGVRANRNLDIRRTYYFNHNTDLTTRGGPMIVEAWARLAELHDTLRTYLRGSRKAS